MIDGEYSMPKTIKTGAPQGSLLGPDLFSCSDVPLEVMFERLGVNYHFYSDDIVTCFIFHDSINQGAFDLIPKTLQKRFSGAKLRLNSSNTVYMFSSRNNCSNGYIEFHQMPIFLNNVTVLGFNLNSRLSYTKQVSYVCRRCYYFLRKSLFHQRYSRQKVIDRVNSNNGSLATRLLQLTVLRTTCV